MSEQNPKETRLADEFRQLGENLVEVMRTAWESPERKRLQQDITTGLNELGGTLRTEAQKLGESEAAQKIRSGAMESQVREELLSALKTINQELERAVQRINYAGTGAGSQTGSGTQSGPSQAPGEGKGWQPSESVGQATTQAPIGPSPHGHYEVNPDDVNAPGPGTEHQEVNPDDAG